MWVYRFFYWMWTPILKERPDLVKLMLEHNFIWLSHREKEALDRRATFRIVQNEDNSSQ